MSERAPKARARKFELVWAFNLNKSPKIALEIDSVLPPKVRQVSKKLKKCYCQTLPLTNKSFPALLPEKQKLKVLERVPKARARKFELLWAFILNKLLKIVIEIDVAAMFKGRFSIA